MVESVIALGSNIGDREANLRLAIKAVGRYGTLTSLSSVYETEPMYEEDQGWFLNCVLTLDTQLGPRALLDALQSVEAEMGRVRGKRNGPRLIDLDILFYGDSVILEPGMEIPHPRIAERLFVLAPLADLAPGRVHPVLGKTVAELAGSLKSTQGVVRRPAMLADLVPG
jgi:2-amino-4-hydroxy-6-hydroxymethyldihydropteridine diphosphokinase